MNLIGGYIASLSNIVDLHFLTVSFLKKSFAFFET